VRPLLLAAAAAAAFLARPACAQYAQGTNLFVQTASAATGILQAQLQDSEDLENVYYPNKYILPADYYSFLPPDRLSQYTQNVIFNPCQGYEYNCCFDTYGTPEYQVVDSSPKLPDGSDNPNYGLRTSVLDDGSIIDPTTSRLPDDEFFIDNSCTGVNLPASRERVRPAHTSPCTIVHPTHAHPTIFPSVPPICSTRARTAS
jgi:hypothetical protein